MKYINTFLLYLNKIRFAFWGFYQTSTSALIFNHLQKLYYKFMIKNKNMKDLYFRISHLLIIKPYLDLALIIVSMIIIRIIFMQTVYADSWDWNPGKFLLSEPVEAPATETDKGVIQYPESIKGLANLLLSSEIYSSDVSSETDSDTNSSDTNSSDTNSSDNETEIVKNTEHNDYEQIIKDIQQIRTQCKGKSQLVEQTIQYVKNIIPQDVLALSDEDMNKEDCLFRLYINDCLLKSSINTAQEYLSQQIYLTALSTYNAIHLTNEEVPPNIVEDVYFQTLTKYVGNEKVIEAVLRQLGREEMLEKAKNFKRPQI